MDIFEAARTGDRDRLARLIQGGADVNVCDRWDAFPLYYACLTGQEEAARVLLDAGAGAVFARSHFEGERCCRAALNLRIRRLLRSYEVQERAQPPLGRLPAALRSAPPDITLHVQGRPIEAHRLILAARSPYFHRKLTTQWRNRRQVRFSSSHGMSFELMRSLVDFFYSDRVDVPVDDVQAFARVCGACKCDGLVEQANRFIARRRYRDAQPQPRQRDPNRDDYPQRQTRFVWQAESAQDRLPAALRRILQDCLANSFRSNDGPVVEACRGSSSGYDDLADIRIKAGDRVFRCHQLILASRSDYFKTRLSRRADFLERHDHVLEEHGVSAEAFEKVLKYVYTDELENLGDDDPLLQAEELLDVASRYLLFPLKPVVADLLRPHLDQVPLSPAELCRWLMLSDMYDAAEVREHCLDIIACNIEAFAEATEFQALLRTQTSALHLLNDLRMRWPGVSAAGVGWRDHERAAALFDRLETLVLAAEQEANDR